MYPGLFHRFIESAIMFVVSCWLIKHGIYLLLSVKLPLIIIAAIALFIVILWRTIKWRNHRDDY